MVLIHLAFQAYWHYSVFPSHNELPVIFTCGTISKLERKASWQLAITVAQVLVCWFCMPSIGVNTETKYNDMNEIYFSINCNSACL